MNKPKIKRGQVAVLAKLAGVTPGYISKLIAGKRNNPSGLLANRLAHLTKTKESLWSLGTPAQRRAATGAMET